MARSGARRGIGPFTAALALGALQCEARGARAPDSGTAPSPTRSVATATGGTAQPASTGGDPFTERRAEREHMVRTTIEAEGVDDARVLAAMRRVPRHRFVPESVRGAAYADRPLPIGWGQTISQPYIVAAMTAAVAPKPTDRCLEIGTG
ncbi:MAG TPA: hypothetical protein VKY73_22550, partial [Polyangiaceae bacterium]|nr:hypothetical protein [Polyangiaceae bacterium]